MNIIHEHFLTHPQWLPARDGAFPGAALTCLCCVTWCVSWLLRDISPACSLQQKPAAMKALVHSVHVCTRSCAAPPGLWLMSEARLKCSGTQPVQIAGSERASLSLSLLCLMLYKGLLVEIEWRLPLNFDLFSFCVQHCHLRIPVWFSPSFPYT